MDQRPWLGLGGAGWLAGRGEEGESPDSGCMDGDVYFA